MISNDDVINLKIDIEVLDIYEFFDKYGFHILLFDDEIDCSDYDCKRHRGPYLKFLGE